MVREAGMSKQYKANEGSFGEFALPTSYRFLIPSVPFSTFNSFVAKGNRVSRSYNAEIDKSMPNSSPDVSNN